MFHNVISSENAPKAIGSYSPGLCLNGLVLLSGQLPINPASGRIETEDIREQTRQAMKNIGALLNEAYAEYVEEPYPVRSCVQVAALPLGAKVEIEVTCVRGAISYE